MPSLNFPAQHMLAFAGNLHADLSDHLQDHDLKAFLTQLAVHRLASFLTECRSQAAE